MYDGPSAQYVSIAETQEETPRKHTKQDQRQDHISKTPQINEKREAKAKEESIGEITRHSKKRSIQKNKERPC